MIDHNRRGRIGMKGTLAIAAAVLAAGGAAGVVALDAGHGTVSTVQSAGFTVTAHHTLSEAASLTLAFDDWTKSPAKSLAALAEMTPMRAFREQRAHDITFAAQRGTAVRVTKEFIIVKSASGALHQWRLSGVTRFKDLAGSATGMAALTGGKKAPAMRAAKDLMRGDLVLVVGARVHGVLIARLVLFAGPAKGTPMPTASATPTASSMPSTGSMPSATPTTTTLVLGSHS